MAAVGTLSRCRGRRAAGRGNRAACRTDQACAVFPGHTEFGGVRARALEAARTLEKQIPKIAVDVNTNWKASMRATIALHLGLVLIDPANSTRWIEDRRGGRAGHRRYQSYAREARGNCAGAPCPTRS